jgi:putative transposase
MTYRTNSGGVYQIRYHFAWCPKFRRPVLVDAIAVRLRELIREKVAEL